MGLPSSDMNNLLGGDITWAMDEEFCLDHQINSLLSDIGLLNYAFHCSQKFPWWIRD